MIENKNGFTLIELMVALVVASTGILYGLLPAHILVSSRNAMSMQKSIASIAAMEMMDNFHSWSMKQGAASWIDLVRDPGVATDGTCPTVTPYSTISRNGIEYKSYFIISNPKIKVSIDSKDYCTTSLKVVARVYWQPAQNLAGTANGPCTYTEFTTILNCLNFGDEFPGGCKESC
jgi:prepilin-type N-terminal cleavage/methylation domain-containing protein